MQTIQIDIPCCRILSHSFLFHFFFLYAEAPTDILIQRVGDEGQEVIASAGEEIELECIVSGGNPPAKLRWFAGEQELQSGHTQEDTRPTPNSRTWMSVSRLTLPVSKDDNGATIRCLAEHPTLESAMSTKTQLTIHCKLQL